MLAANYTNVALVKCDVIVQVFLMPYGNYNHIEGKDHKFSLSKVYDPPSIGDRFYYNSATKRVLTIQKKEFSL
jgi:hypothetical protein